MSRQDREFGNDRNEIYDRRDGKKKRRDWRDKRHQESRREEREQSKPNTRDVYDDGHDNVDPY